MKPTSEEVIFKKLIKQFRTYAVRWRADELEKLALAGVAARAAIKSTTGLEPEIENLARMTFRACMPIMHPAT